MAVQGQWGGEWSGNWQGALEAAPGSMSGTASWSISATATLTAGEERVKAGKGSTLGDFEAQWERERAFRVEPQATKPRAKKAKRLQAPVIQTAPPAAVVAYVDRLKEDAAQARDEEIKALLSWAIDPKLTDWTDAQDMAQRAKKKHQEALQAIEEFDVIYVTALMAA